MGAVTEQASRGREVAPIKRKCQSVIILNDVRGAADANCCCCAFAAHSSGFVSKFPRLFHFVSFFASRTQTASLICCSRLALRCRVL